MVRLSGLLLPFVLAACAAFNPIPPEGPVPALLLGEQHDAPEHQKLHRDVVDALAARGVLAAVVLEMAEGGHSTLGLPAAATEQQVQAALGWNNSAWPWDQYGPAVMAAVRAGAPVFGSNLNSTQMRAAMADASLDGLLPEPALRVQREAIRAGHCNMLPETQIPPMVRVQIARDQAMARTILAAAAKGKTVVLLAGSGHVNAQAGVPQHLRPQLRAESVMLPPVDTGKDYCEDFRKSRGKPPA
ncbi:ChaN family lipoprotein [Ramlibacter albus]|uniref:ChaN family lipoprotein n=1 Tax=Ramlibacter albus TaxID=2079448 RepID=A0A923M544_9BURK|nr:ChaN family lipoprotein [Ramlibacter albus]MBC5763555.1 ChaN family lipoprotein [Ramlibacter albus]